MNPAWLAPARALVAHATRAVGAAAVMIAAAVLATGAMPAATAHAQRARTERSHTRRSHTEPGHAERGHTERRQVEPADQLGDPAHPPEESALDAFGLELTAGTQVPLAIGAGLRLDMPLGFFVSAWAGGMPEGYAEVYREVAGAYGVEDDARDLVTRVGTGTFVFRADAGIRPVPHAGLEIAVGYTLLYAGSTLTTSEIEAATGQSIVWPPGVSTIRLDVALHALHAQLAWRFLIEDHFVLRLAVGWTHALGTDARLGVPEAMRRASSMVADTERAIAEGVGTYGFTPTAEASIGYRF